MPSKSLESQNVEFKSNLRDEYLKAICAFANANGDSVILSEADNDEL
jgi:ATP-dependent DNA helicase RecG